MVKRVEICGIDTSKLPKISAVESVEMLQRIKDGDTATRELFIIANLRLVLSIIQRYARRSANADDLFQVGCVGLCKAIDNFNVDLNVKFSTYAVPMIMGEIRRYLRDGNSLKITRSLRDTAYKALQFIEQYERIEGKPPRAEEIASALGIKVSEVNNALDAISEPISLYEPVYNQSDDTLMIYDQIKDEKSNDEVWTERVALLDAVAKLGDKERDILTKRYFEGKTQIEVSNEVGISQAQVSRLEKTALDKIKRGI